MALWVRRRPPRPACVGVRPRQTRVGRIARARRRGTSGSTSSGASLPLDADAGSGAPDGRERVRAAGDCTAGSVRRIAARLADRSGIVGEPSHDEHGPDAGGAASNVRGVGELARSRRCCLGVRSDVDAGRERSGAGEPEGRIEQVAGLRRQAQRVRQASRRPMRISQRSLRNPLRNRSPRARRPNTSMSMASRRAPAAASTRRQRRSRAPSNRMVSCGSHSSQAASPSSRATSSIASAPALR